MDMMEYLASMTQSNSCYNSVVDQEVYGHYVYLDRLVDSYLVMHEVEAAVNDTLEIDKAGRNKDKLVSDQNDCANDKLVVDECDIGNHELIIDVGEFGNDTLLIDDAECEHDKLVINSGELTEFSKLIIDEDYSKSDVMISDDDGITSNDELVIDESDAAADASTLAEIAHCNRLVILDHDYATLAARGLKAQATFTGTDIDNQSKECSSDNCDEESLGQKTSKTTLRSSTEHEETEDDEYRNNVHADHNYPGVINYIEQIVCCDELHVKHNKGTSLRNPNSFQNKYFKSKPLRPTDIDVTDSNLEGYWNRTQSKEHQIWRKSQHEFNDVDYVKRSVQSTLCQLESNISHIFNVPLVSYCRDNSVPASHNQLYHEDTSVVLNTTHTQNINSLNYLVKTENESNNGTGSNNTNTLHHLTSDQDANLLEDSQSKCINKVCKNVSCDTHSVCAMKFNVLDDAGSRNGLPNNELQPCTKPGANEIEVCLTHTRNVSWEEERKVTVVKCTKHSKEARMKRNERMTIVKCPKVKASQSPGSTEIGSNTVKHAFNRNCVINRVSKNSYTLSTETVNQENTDIGKRKSVLAKLVDYDPGVIDKLDMCDVDTFDIKPDVSQPLGSNFVIDDIATVISETPISINTVDLKPDISQLSTYPSPSGVDVSQNSMEELYMKAINDSNDAGSVDADNPEIKILQCLECWSVFSEIAAYDVHVLKCPTESKKSQICNICRVAFTDMRTLYTHDCNRRRECYDYTCGVCSKAFKKRDIIFAHMKIHKSEKEYVCEICQKCFLHKHHLIHHMITHNVDRPFKCQVCSAGFKRASNLQKHQNSHKPDADKNYKCSYCTSSFYEKYKLIRHEETHTCLSKKFICSICKYPFRTKCMLLKHMEKSHSGEQLNSSKKSKRQLKCNICDEAFFWNKHLKNHMKSHKNGISDNDEDDEIECDHSDTDNKDSEDRNKDDLNGDDDSCDQPTTLHTHITRSSRKRGRSNIS